MTFHQLRAREGTRHANFLSAPQMTSLTIISPDHTFFRPNVDSVLLNIFLYVLKHFFSILGNVMFHMNK